MVWMQVTDTQSTEQEQLQGTVMAWFHCTAAEFEVASTPPASCIPSSPEPRGSKLSAAHKKVLAGAVHPCMQACMSLDVDIISLDLATRLPFKLRGPAVQAAVNRGVHFEVRTCTVTIQQP